MVKKPRVLMFVGSYLPGYKAGGPIRSLAGIVERLSQWFDFSVFTRDRDIGEQVPYAEVRPDTWQPVGAAKVFYASCISFKTIRRVVREAAPDVIYINGFFCRISMRVLALYRLRLLPRVPVILAPRGEFSAGAFALKRWKKLPYTWLALKCGFYRGLVWQASTELEKQDIERIMGKCDLRIAPVIRVARDLTTKAGVALAPGDRAKHAGAVRFVFMSRVSPIKNLPFLLQVLRQLSGKVVLDIYGPAEDREHWDQCARAMKSLPPNVTATYHGALAHHEVASTLARYHFLAFPTQGENFGHVIAEALLAACPVVISDQTPWVELEAQGVGWDLPLQQDLWRTVLQSCVDMDQEAYSARARRAHQFVVEQLNSSEGLGQNVDLFLHALGSSDARHAAMPVGAIQE
jgi:glycosyltransferase involved in cell wall biosynthesis